MKLEEIESIKVISEALIKEQYQLSDIGLTSKTAFDWQKAGIYPKERKSKFRRKYNGLEYTWLRMVFELRELGLSLSSIHRLKEFLFKENDVIEFMLEAIFEEDEVQDKEYQEIKLLLQQSFKTKQNLIEEIGKADIDLLNTTYGVLLFSVAFSKSDTHLLINKDGDCFVFDDPMQDTFASSAIMKKPYISFPVKYVLSELIDQEHLFELENLDEYIKLSEEERKVLKLMRLGEIKKLTAHYKKDKITMVEVDQIEDPRLANQKVIDVMQSDYENLSYENQDGEIVYVVRKTKYKI